MRAILAPAITVFALTMLGVGPAKAQSVKPPCADNSRACMIKVVKIYIDAMTRRDPSKVPFAHDVVCTEQGKPYLVGEDKYRWELTNNTVPFEAVRDFRFYVDEKRHDVFAFFTIALKLKGEDHSIHKVERFKIEKGYITEAEVDGIDAPGTLTASAGWPADPATP